MSRMDYTGAALRPVRPEPGAHPSPGHFSGRYLLTDNDSGSQLRLASVCKVGIPLVGGALKQLILSNITMLFDAEEAFLAEWIAKHH